MFKKKESEMDIKTGIELVKEAKECLVVLNEKTGLVQGTRCHLYALGMSFIENLIENKVITLSDIFDNFADCDNHIVKINATDEKSAFKQLDKEVEKMKKTISERIKKEEK